MKKLISAASALAMAASMVGAAVPFATGAADASKGFELRVFENPDGTTPSTTITADQIAAGDVTIPVGVYLVESAADSQGISAMWTVNSKDGDATNTNVTFTSHNVGTKYFDEPRIVTTDKDYKTDMIIGFAGTLSSGRAGVTFTAHGRGQYGVDTKQDTWGIADRAYGSAIWTKPATSGYTWTGSTSDAFPMFVFDVTFKKGTPAGTYSIDFLDQLKTGSTEIWSTMIESSTNYNPTAGNLNLKNLEIKIEGESVPPTTTATPPVTTATPPVTTAVTPPVTTATPPTPTTPGEGDPWQNDPINKDFKIVGEVCKYDEDWNRSTEYKPGDTVTVEFILQDSLNKKATTLAAIPQTDEAFNKAGLKLEMTDNLDYTSDPKANWTLTGETYYCYRMDSAQDPTGFAEGEAIISFNVELPADLAPGDYVVDMYRFTVVEQTDPKVAFRPGVTPAVIHVDGKVPPVTTEAPPVTTKAPVTTATTAVKPPVTTATPPTTTVAPGSPLYGDANDDKKVDIADVVVLNKWINDNKAYNLTPQGKLNADCCDPKGGDDINQNDSDAIIMSIVHLVKDADGNAKALPYTAADLK